MAPSGETMTNPEAQLCASQTSQRRRCPTCNACASLTHCFLDSRRGKTIRLYQCAECGERLWDDGSRLLAEVFGDPARSGSQPQ
jgi:uncharacterized protein YlaI